MKPVVSSTCVDKCIVYRGVAFQTQVALLHAHKVLAKYSDDRCGVEMLRFKSYVMVVLAINAKFQQKASMIRLNKGCKLAFHVASGRRHAQIAL
jgi:hypothetical protein